MSGVELEAARRRLAEARAQRIEVEEEARRGLAGWDEYIGALEDDLARLAEAGES